MAHARKVEYSASRFSAGGLMRVVFRVIRPSYNSTRPFVLARPHRFLLERKPCNNVVLMSADITGNEAETLKKPVVAIIDDDRIGRWAMSVVLQDTGYETIAACTGEGILQKIAEQNEPLAAIIAEYRLRGDSDGVDVSQRISRACGHRIPAIILSGRNDDGARRKIRDAAFVYCAKPIEPAKLLALLELALSEG